MNEAEIRERIAAIRAGSSDDECAHSMEDCLYENFVRSIANGECVNPQACAQLLLTTKNIKFYRWCA